MSDRSKLCRLSSQDIALFAALGATLLVYYLSPSLWLSLAAGLGFLALAWARLDLALLYVVFAAPFYRFPKAIDPAPLGIAQLLGRGTALELSLAEFAVLACFAAWLAQQVWKPPPQRGMQGAAKTHLSIPLVLPPLLLLLAATLSLAASEFLRYSLREYRTVILEPLLFYFLLLQTWRTERELWRTVNALMALGAAVSLFALYHYFFVGGGEATGGVRRMLAIYDSPNALALFLGRIVPLAMVLLLMAKGKTKLVYLAVCLSLLAALLFTFSRGAWLGVGAALLFVAFMYGSRRVTAAAAALGVLVVAAIGVLVPLGRLVSAASVSQRGYLWRAALDMIRDHPLMGVGLDNFLYQYPKYQLPQAWAEPNMSHPHNILLDFWTRVGILGVAAMVWLEWAFWREGLRLYRKAGQAETRAVVLGLMASMVDFLVHGLIDNSFFLVDLAFVFWLTYGLMMAVAQQQTANRKQKQEGAS